MSTVNFSVPDDVKEAFNHTFQGQNKSAVIAELMRQAVDNAALAARRRETFRVLTERRDKRPNVTGEQMRAAREKGRE